MARARPWLLILVPSFAASIALWNLRDTAESAPIWTVIVWLVLALAAVIAAGVAFASGERGKKLILYGLWGAAAALLLLPTVHLIVFFFTWFL